ncbi:MAG TPA: OmpA family protein [Candidatus Binatia bacterium]|nr:OmpA family protein [Candidatus Binatia bacterium]
MKKLIAGLCLAALSAGASAAAAPDRGRDSDFDVLFSTMLSPDSSRLPDVDKSYGLDLRYGGGQLFGLPLEYRAYYDQLTVKPAGFGDRYRAGAGANVLFPFGNMGWVSPYAIGGAGVVYTDADQPAKEAKFGLSAGIGGGVISKPVFHDWRVRAELEYGYQKVHDGLFDLSLHVGLEFPLGQRPSRVEVKETAVKVVEAPAAVTPEGDGDGDGVGDGADRCPDTAKGQTVDQSGCTVKEVVALKGVTFEVNSDQLTAESLPILDEAGRSLNEKYSGAKIEIAGHTDSTGDDGYNLQLSKRRAEAVRQYLIQSGVDAARLSAAGYGETQPVGDNESREGRSRNRRVELRIRE